MTAETPLEGSERLPSEDDVQRACESIYRRHEGYWPSESERVRICSALVPLSEECDKAIDAAAVAEERATTAENALAPLVDALKLIGRNGCETFTGSATCRGEWSGRTRGARYGADAWCDACIAIDALAAAGPLLEAQESQK